MSKFTKGQWLLDDQDNVYVNYINDEGKNEKVYIVPYANGIYEGEAEFNARLIAAAPEMYEILKRIDTVQDNYEVAAAESEIPALLARIDVEEAQA